MEWARSGEDLFVRLDPGEEIHATLQSLADKVGFDAAAITSGIGRTRDTLYGYMDEDGFLFLVDRRNDMIVTGGANVYPAEVEAALDAHPNVHSSAVIGLPDEDLGQRIHAIVQARPPISEDEIRAHLAEHLVRYKTPRSFEFTDQPLRDDAGKVRRSKLRDDRIAAADRSD